MRSSQIGWVYCRTIICCWIYLLELKTAGFSASDLRVAGFTASNLKDINFSAKQLSVGGYTGVQIYAAGYTVVDFYNAGFNPTRVVAAGFTLGQLNVSGFVKADYTAVNITSTDLRTAGFTPSELYTAGFSAGDLYTAGYTSDLLFNIYSIGNMRGGGYTATDMKNGNYDLVALKNGGYTATELKGASYSAFQLRSAGFSLSTLIQAGFTCAELYDGGYSAGQLLTAGFTLTQLYNANVSCADLKSAGFNTTQLLGAGFTYTDLRIAGFTVTQVKSGGGVSDQTLLAAGYTQEDILKAGMNLYLDYFSSSYRLLATSTLIDGKAETLLDASATAVFYIPESTIQNVFKFRLIGDLMDFSNVEVRYVVNMHLWPTSFELNPSNAMLDQPDSNGSVYSVGNSKTMLVKHDYIRYLALKLFGNANAVDLFNNESQMVRYMNYIGNLSFQNDISGTLWKYASVTSNPTSANYLLDTSNNMKYTTDAFNTNNNICRELMYQLIYYNPDRFANLITDENYLVSIPIFAGDTISFNYTIAPAPNQNNLTGVPPIPARTYRIKWVIDNGTGVNTVPDL
jgi:uncharacterized protein YjbI with pentapeptide repeats